MRRYEAIVDAARAQHMEPEPTVPPAVFGARLVSTLLYAALWWFFPYAVLHTLIYVVLLGGPGLGLEQTAQFVATYLVSFDQAIAAIAACIAVLGCAAGWLPGSEPGLIRPVTAPLERYTGRQIVVYVLVAKIITSVWAAVFAAPFEAYSSFGVVLAGSGLWALVAALLALAGYGFGRWLVVLALVLDLATFGYLTVQLLPAIGTDVTWIQAIALIAFLIVTCIMLAFFLVSTRINRLFGT